MATDGPTLKDREPPHGVSAAMGWVAGAALGLAVVALVVAGVAWRNSVDNDQGGPAPVAVTLSDFHIGLATSTLPAGQATFDISNSAGDDHEFLVFVTDLDPSAFPKEADGSVNEEGPGITKISDGDNIAPGGNQTRSVELKAGTYVLVCNLPGHFAQGMHTVITVH